MNIITLGYSKSIEANYLYNLPTAAAIQRQIDEKVNALQRSALNAGANMIDKEWFIYNYLAKNTKYCKDDSIDDRTNYSIVGPLLHGIYVCEGYAKAFKHLCDAISLPCVVASGTAVSPDGGEGPHAWNIVKPGSECFHADATWDSIHDDMTYTDYFNISDKTMQKDHTWDSRLYPLCNRDMYPIPYVSGRKEFEDLILANICRNNMTIPVMFSRQFDNVSDITDMVMKFIEASALTEHWNGWRVNTRYNKSQSKAVITISVT